jgi:hypothetical protein
MNQRRGLLMRVGIDQTFGEYNAPMNPETGDYIYMPIPESRREFKPGMSTTYDSMVSKFDCWNKSNGSTLVFPPHLQGKNCHLDPDFDYVSYGDQATGRGLRVCELQKGDFLAFFASFKPTHACEHKLIYALYGIIVVDSISTVKNLEPVRFHENAHTRVLSPDLDHLVVFGDPILSGRFDKAIPIGEFRNGSYRVTNPMLDAWGGIGVKDGFIQRSVNPPWFNDGEKFLRWLGERDVKRIQSNW